MAIKLKVPFVTQLGIGTHATTMGESMQNLFEGKGLGRDDPTGCWYASVCMIGYYYGAGPRRGAPNLFKQQLPGGDVGHFATGTAEAFAADPDHHKKLAQNEQLEPVYLCRSRSHNYSLADIEGLLRDSGPIFMYWKKWHAGFSYGHASVIIGTTNAGIIYHDPENAPNSRMSLDQFNYYRQRWEYALMQKEGVSAVESVRGLFG
jgi:hypothetical protein